MASSAAAEAKRRAVAKASTEATRKAAKKNPVIETALDVIPGARFLANTGQVLSGNKVSPENMQSGYLGLIGGAGVAQGLASAGKAIGMGARALGSSEPVAKALAVRALSKQGPSAIAFPAQNIGGIAKSGGFKSGLEIGIPQERQILAQQMGVNPDYRILAEQRALGLPLDTPAVQRPVYGALTASKLPLPVPKGSLVDEMQTALSTGNKTLKQYGGAVAVMKPGANKGATATIGDSAGAFIGSNTKIAAPLEGMTMRDLAKAGGNQLVTGFKNSRGVADYIETQLSPKMTTLDNVAKIIAPDTATQAIIKAALREAGWNTKVKLSQEGKLKIVKDFLKKFEKSPLQQAPRPPLGQRGIVDLEETL